MANITAITPFGLTEKGLDLQLKVQTGKAKLDIVGIVIGDGYLTEGQSIVSLAELVHEIPTQTNAEVGTKPKADITRIYKGQDENGNPVCMISTVIQNGDNADTVIREFGVLANDPDEGKILYGAGNLGDSAMPFPPYDDKVHVAWDWDFSTYISNTTDVTANITFVAGVPRKDFDVLSQIVQDIKSSVTSLQSRELGMIHNISNILSDMGNLKLCATTIEKSEYMPRYDYENDTPTKYTILCVGAGGLPLNPAVTVGLVTATAEKEECGYDNGYRHGYFELTDLITGVKYLQSYVCTNEGVLDFYGWTKQG